VTDAALASLTGTECKSGCRPGTLDYYTIIPQAGNCAYKIEKVSPKCLTGTAATAAAAKTDFCAPGTATLYSYDNDTAAWVTADNTPRCVEELAQAVASGNMTSSAFGNMIPGDNPLAGFNFFFSPLFLAFIAHLVLSIIPTVGMLKYGVGETGDAFLIFTLLFGALALMFSFVGLYPAILGLMMVIIAGLLLAAQIRQAMAGE
jgi:hypothetical protein